MGRIHFLPRLILACLVLGDAVKAGGGPYYYTGAQWAVQAQCPAGHPIGCSSIGAANYCCPSGQYCTWADAKVACCPDDCSCSGWSTGQDTYQSSWRAHSSYVAPQSSWRASPTCDVCGAQTTTVVIAPASQPAGGYQGYCSTIYAQGPGLPTTRQGDCGVVLIESPAPNAGGRGVEVSMGWRMLGWVVGLQVVGGMVLVWR